MDVVSEVMYSTHCAISSGVPSPTLPDTYASAPISFGEVHELVRAERVRLFDAAPVRVHAHRSLVARTDAFAPVVFIGKAASRPADHRHLQALQRSNHIVAVAVGVRDLRVFADPDAAVDAEAQVLCKLAERGSD